MIGMIEKVESSTISAVMYLAEKQELFIQFIGGTVYRYLEVSLEQYATLMGSESKGSYFNMYIKGKYPTHKVTGFPALKTAERPSAWDIEVLYDLSRSLQLDGAENKMTQNRITALHKVLEYVERECVK